MDYLVFQLQAPLSSWGEPAVGEFRGTGEHPTQSALIGLLGAALGLHRDDEAGHAGLRDGYGYAIGMLSAGSLLRDYHTAQVPTRSALVGRPQSTRRQEMAVEKQKLVTILSTRDYRQSAAHLIAIQGRSTSVPPYGLPQLADALRAPKFVLYLGRKSCPPAAPLWPKVISTDSARSSFGRYCDLYQEARAGTCERGGPLPLEPLLQVVRIAFDDHIDAGVRADLTTVRKDRLVRRKGWQFGDRTEHISLVEGKV